MSDRTLRILIAAAITLMLAHEIGRLVAGAFGMVWGVATSVAIAAVSFMSARLARAGGRSSAWFLLPTLLFTVAPMAYVTWDLVAGEAGWVARLAGIAPFLARFGVPVILLLVVYYALRWRTAPGAAVTSPPARPDAAAGADG